MDLLAQSARLGLDAQLSDLQPQSSLTLADEAEAAGWQPPDYVVDQLKSGELKFADRGPGGGGELAAHPEPVALQPVRLLAKGNEYFLKHLLGTDNGVSATEAGEDQRPGRRVAREGAEGKLDLLMTLDFRMTSSTLLLRRRAAGGDLVREARHQHHGHAPVRPLLQPGDRPAVAVQDDWDAWKEIAKRFSELAVDHLGVRKDVVAKPLWHDTPEAMATVHGASATGAPGECEPVPGKTLPVLAVVERDYGAIYDKMTSIGPLMEKVGMLTKGVPYDVKREVDIPAAAQRHGAHGGVGAGQPKLETDDPRRRGDPAPVRHHNGHLATHGFKTSRSAPAPSCTTCRPSTRASRSPSPTPRPPRSGHHLARSGRVRRPAGAATPRSRSTSSGSSPSTP
jgi:nitrate reductase alpha subunit